MTLAIISFVHLAKTKVLETIDRGIKMIERNTTVLTMTDAVLFTSSADHNTPPTATSSPTNPHPVLTSPRSFSICGSRVVPWRRATCHPSHLRADQAARGGTRPSNHQRSNERSPVVLPCQPDIHHHTRESEPAAAMRAGKGLLPSPAVFLQVAIVKKINHSLSIFKQSVQDYSRSPTTPHEAESKQDQK
ncbi:hypothetical protein BLNAU_11915 [Blattamonas nauphoetae]|uniref:Uncharacterized protein n=1 Tax=Blattamonas nauphoetae TaxID=2049346 RepID=A0ABQ9XNN8_9EUKA|nr:hypothetical protein BLNAU_11915 [Blattamonas nauphoetae]